MDIWEIDKIALFIVLFLPGFISIKVYDLLIAGPQRDFSKSMTEAIAYSVLNFGACSWLILLIQQPGFIESRPTLYALALVTILVVLPIIWPVLFIKLTKWKWISKHILNPIQEPWDLVFSNRKARWILVHLKDGRKIGGKFGARSCASAFPNERQLYIQELWELDPKGVFIKPVGRTDGLIVCEVEIAMVELFK